MGYCIGCLYLNTYSAFMRQRAFRGGEGGGRNMFEKICFIAVGGLTVYTVTEVMNNRRWERKSGHCPRGFGHIHL